MEVTEITQIINSCGFPIAMTLLMFWYLVKESSEHKAEVTALKDVISQNTVALEKILTLISRGKEDINV